MSRVKVVGGRDFNEFFAPRKFLRKQMEEIETADDETRKQARDRAAEKQQQDPQQAASLWCLRQPMEPQRHKRAGDEHESDQSDQAVEDNSEQTARFFVGFLQQQIALNDVAASATGKKLIVKHADQEQAGDSRQRKANILDAEKNLPPHGGGNFNDDIRENADSDPPIVGMLQGSPHF